MSDFSRLELRRFLLRLVLVAGLPNNITYGRALSLWQKVENVLLSIRNGRHFRDLYYPVCRNNQNICCQIADFGFQVLLFSEEPHCHRVPAQHKQQLMIGRITLSSIAKTTTRLTIVYYHVYPYTSQYKS